MKTWVKCTESLQFRGFPTRKVYLCNDNYIVMIYHSGRKPSICKVNFETWKLYMDNGVTA